MGAILWERSSSAIAFKEGSYKGCIAFKEGSYKVCIAFKEGSYKVCIAFKEGLCRLRYHEIFDAA